MKINKAIIIILLLLIGLSVSSCDMNDTKTSNTEVLEITDEKNLETERLSATCDMVLASGDGYELVANQIDSYDKSIIEVGVIKNNEWLVPLSTKSPFVTEEGVWRIKDHPMNNKDGFEYIGNGCFILHENPELLEDYSIKNNSVIYCAETNVGFYDCDIGIYHTFGGVYAGNVPELYFNYQNIVRENEFIATGVNGCLNLNNLATGESKVIGGFFHQQNYPREIGPYSEGLFYATGKNDAYKGFFNAEGQMVINLEDYNTSYIVKNDTFENGQVVLRCENPNGIEFNITIDTEGRIIKEEKIEN